MLIDDQKVQLHVSRSDLSGSRFDDVNLSTCDVENANMSGVRISNANLTGVVMRDVRLDGATIEGILVTDLFACWRAQHGANRHA